MYLVAVTFDVHAGHAQSFATRVARQAADSLREPGCRRFDVWTDPADPARVFLFEIYDDRAAFDAHLATDHFTAFDAEVGPWVRGKTVETWVLAEG